MKPGKKKQPKEGGTTFAAQRFWFSARIACQTLRLPLGFGSPTEKFWNFPEIEEFFVHFIKIFKQEFTMKFTYISEQRVLKILRALREVSEDLSRCRLPRSVILRKVLQRNVPSTVLTLARSNDLQDLVEVVNYRNASGRRNVEWWYLTKFGAVFLKDPNATPPERFEQKYEEPDEVKARRLREGKKARRREQRELRRARRIRLGTQPDLSHYNEVVENAHDYTWGEINRLALAKKIAVLRTRAGFNQEAKQDQERIDYYWRWLEEQSR